MSEIDSMNNLIDSYINEINNLQEQLQQLKAENEELQEMNRNLSEKFANVCGGCFEQELREKYEQCIDGIEECIDNFCDKTCPYYDKEDGCCCCCILDDIAQPILQLIKQAKESE